jgi:hypothetical protein
MSRRDQVLLGSMRLQTAYLPRCRLPKRIRRRFHREWARRLLRAGYAREARPHLWAWWRMKPLQLEAPRLLLGGAPRARERP